MAKLRKKGHYGHKKTPVWQGLFCAVANMLPSTAFIMAIVSTSVVPIAIVPIPIAATKTYGRRHYDDTGGAVATPIACAAVIVTLVAYVVRIVWVPRIVQIEVIATGPAWVVVVVNIKAEPVETAVGIALPVVGQIAAVIRVTAVVVAAIALIITYAVVVITAVVVVVVSVVTVVVVTVAIIVSTVIIIVALTAVVVTVTPVLCTGKYTAGQYNSYGGN